MEPILDVRFYAADIGARDVLFSIGVDGVVATSTGPSVRTRSERPIAQMEKILSIQWLRSKISLLIRPVYKPCVLHTLKTHITVFRTTSKFLIPIEILTQHRVCGVCVVESDSALFFA